MTVKQTPEAVLEAPDWGAPPDTDIAGLVDQLFCGQEGVVERILWEAPDGSCCAGTLVIAAGVSLPAHWHHSSAHHRWIVRGTCRLSGTRAGPGHYEFVPPGAEHGLDETGPEGCTLFFVSVG